MNKKHWGVPTVVTAMLTASTNDLCGFYPGFSQLIPKCERIGNVSDEEVKVLLELYEQDFHTLKCKFSSVLRQKMRLWADITTAVLLPCRKDGD